MVLWNIIRGKLYIEKGTVLSGYIIHVLNNSSLFEGKKGGAIIIKYLCTVCGYIYDPEAGDPDGGVEPGTAFEDIPDDWVCPECGVGKDMFEPLDE